MKWKAEDIKVYWSSVKFTTNVVRYEATCADWSAPVGIAYVAMTGTQHGKCHGSLQTIRVDKDLRRQGIATRMHQVIAKHCDILTTCHNKDSKALLKKLGYKYVAITDEYVLKTHRKKAKA